MSDPTITPAVASLQFDKAVGTQMPLAAGAGVVCSHCRATIADSYFTIAGRPICETCKRGLEQAMAATRTPGAFARAFVFGLGAAIAGAIVYYAVMALLNLEIGIVAILIGYMVGYAIHKATRGGGGRRYQILGAALTYFAVGLAYMPIAIKEASEKPAAAADSSHVSGGGAAAQRADSANARSDAASGAATGGTTKSSTSLIRILGMLVFFTVALPVMVIVGSMPSGLISAAIIGFGMRRAWQMTAAPDLSFAGPLRVASGFASPPLGTIGKS